MTNESPFVPTIIDAPPSRSIRPAHEPNGTTVPVVGDVTSATTCGPRTISVGSAGSSAG